MTQAIDLQLQGYRLTTANILYRMPDHQHLLQSFLWQELDMAPSFPVLNRFLKFWEENIEGPIHSVTVGAKGLVSAAELSYCAGEYRLN